MPRPEEVAAWSVDELRAEIQNLLPAGWTMAYSQDPSGYWGVQLQSLNEKQETCVELSLEHADPRLVLLDAYGWLWLRNSPPPSGDSPWVRRNEPALNVARRAAVKGSHIADPEDLDPAEIALVHKSRK